MVRDVDSAAIRYAHSTLRAYLESKQNLNWAIAAIRSSGIRGQTLAEIFDHLKAFGDTTRYKEVYEACKKLEWF